MDFNTIECFPTRDKPSYPLHVGAPPAGKCASPFGPQVRIWNPLGSRSGIVWLPHAAEAGLEALSLKVNTEKNQKVLGDFPHTDNVPDIFLLANVGSTTTQIYDIHFGHFLGGFDGGSKKWSAEASDTLQKIVMERSEGNKRPTSIAIVGAPGYLVPDGPTKWHKPSAVDTPITKWFADLMTDIPDIYQAAVLNRTKAAKISQPNCDWGDAYASLPIGMIREVWPDAPELPPNSLVLDLGGGYSRVYRMVGGKISEWDKYRPEEKTNAVLFDEMEYKPYRIGKLVFQLHNGVRELLRDYPENAMDVPMTLCIIGTGDAREQELAAAKIPV